jgi:hypothetical protein
MKGTLLQGICAGAVIALATAAFAQTTTSPAPATPTATTQQSTAGDQQVTVTGCVQRESDYRRAHDAGRGGVAGTGVGAGNEYVLTSASMSGAGATGTAAAAYELTGTNEGQLAQHVGKRVEISGKLKAAETGASGRPTGGATAGKPPEGVDVVSKDLQLRELEVGSIRSAAGTCPAQ